MDWLKPLDAIHSQGLRLCLEAFRASPVDSLYVDANEPPLDLRRLKLTLQYIVKLKSKIDNPAFDCVLIHNMKFIRQKINKKCIKSIGFRIKEHIDYSNIVLLLILVFSIIKPVSHSKIPPWKLQKPEKNPLDFKQKLAEFKDSKQTGIEIYTDCSKDKNKVAAAAVIKKDVFSARLTDGATIFSAEA